VLVQKKSLEVSQKAREAEQLHDELECERSRAETTKFQAPSERSADGNHSEKELQELSILATTSKAQVDEMR